MHYVRKGDGAGYIRMVGSDGVKYRCANDGHYDFYRDASEVNLGANPKIVKDKPMTPGKHDVTVYWNPGRLYLDSGRAGSRISECHDPNCPVQAYWVIELCRRIVHGDYPAEAKEEATKLYLEVQNR